MDATTITVTDRAAQRIAGILKGEVQDSVLRVSVEGGGCSGFQYRFEVERGGTPEDLVIQHSGATVVIDAISLQYLAGSKLDYVDDLIGASFQVVNPNATASCGCGTSFAL
jgi:iron-sulfur cluster assembly accessory protein